MTIQGINGMDNGSARLAVKQTGEIQAIADKGNAQPEPEGQKTHEGNTAPAGRTTHADKYDHDNAVPAERAAGTSVKGVYNANLSNPNEDKGSAGPDDFREVEVLKRKRQSLLQQLSGESNEVIRSQLQTQIQHVSGQIAMKDSLAAAPATTK